MLSKRYEYDGKPTLKLSAIQEMKEQISSKVKQKYYEFEHVPCCVCNKTEFELLSNKDRYGLYMPVMICKECGLIQTNPRMNQASYNEFYGRSIESSILARRPPGKSTLPSTIIVVN